MTSSQTPLQILLNTYRNASVTEREKGTYFEDLISTYLRNEATYRDLYSKVWTYSAWAREQDIDARDTGIDLVAQTQGTSEYHAIQCKFYAEDYRIQKSDIDSFFTASGKKPFTHRVIVTTTNNWTDHASDALQNQQPPVSKIDLFDLENSQIDWSKYQPKQAPVLKTKKSLRDHQKRALAAVEIGLQSAERGKLIMACGTGKTFTSLKIAEKLAGPGKRVLFLVPSLSLLSQTLISPSLPSFANKLIKVRIASKAFQSPDNYAFNTLHDEIVIRHKEGAKKIVKAKFLEDKRFNASNGLYISATVTGHIDVRGLA